MPNPAAFLAPPGKRIWAGGFDLLAVSVLFLLVVAIGEGSGVDLAAWHTFGLLFAAYNFGCLAFRDGRTLGKTAVDICVVSTAGASISIAQAAMRAGVRAAPFIIVGSPMLALASLLAFGILGLMEMSLIEQPPLRQSFADRVAGTIVVNLPLVQPHRAPAGPLFSATDAEFGGFPKAPPKGEDRGR